MCIGDGDGGGTNGGIGDGDGGDRDDSNGGGRLQCRLRCCRSNPREFMRMLVVKLLQQHNKLHLPSTADDSTAHRHFVMPFTAMLP